MAAFLVYGCSGTADITSGSINEVINNDLILYDNAQDGSDISLKDFEDSCDIAVDILEEVGSDIDIYTDIDTEIGVSDGEG